MEAPVREFREEKQAADYADTRRSEKIGQEHEAGSGLPLTCSCFLLLSFFDLRVSA